MSSEPPVFEGAVPRGLFVGLVVALVFAIACPGSLENKAQFLSCPDVPTEILGKRCATSSCHDDVNPAADLDLTPDTNLAIRIVDVEATQCDDHKIVDTSDPEASLLYTKCTDDNPCLSIMPITGERLTARELECLLEYVESL